MHFRGLHLFFLLAQLMIALLPRGSAASEGSVSLRPLFGPARHQGSFRNTCSAFAAADLAAFVLQEYLALTSFPLLSANYTYWVSKEASLDSDEVRALYRSRDGQAGYRAVLSLLRGVLPEADWPYELRNPAQARAPFCVGTLPLPSECFTGRPPEGAAPWKSQVLSRAQVAWIPRAQIGDFILQKRRPVVMNLLWIPGAVAPNGVVRDYTEGERQGCRTQSRSCFGHVVLLTGFDSRTRHFEFRNSWGSSWGDEGYGWVPESVVLNDCESCSGLPDPSWARDRFFPSPDSPLGFSVSVRAAYGVSLEFPSVDSR